MPCQQSKVNTHLFGGRNQKSYCINMDSLLIFTIFDNSTITNRINFVKNKTTVNSYSFKQTKENKNNTNNKVGFNLTLRLTF